MANVILVQSASQRAPLPAVTLLVTIPFPLCPFTSHTLHSTVPCGSANRQYWKMPGAPALEGRLHLASGGVHAQRGAAVRMLQSDNAAAAPLRVKHIHPNRRSHAPISMEMQVATTSIRDGSREPWEGRWRREGRSVQCAPDDEAGRADDGATAAEAGSGGTTVVDDEVDVEGATFEGSDEAGTTNAGCTGGDDDDFADGDACAVDKDGGNAGAADGIDDSRAEDADCIVVVAPTAGEEDAAVVDGVWGGSDKEDDSDRGRGDNGAGEAGSDDGDSGDSDGSVVDFSVDNDDIAADDSLAAGGTTADSAGEEADPVTGALFDNSGGDRRDAGAQRGEVGVASGSERDNSGGRGVVAVDCSLADGAAVRATSSCGGIWTTAAIPTRLGGSLRVKRVGALTWGQIVVAGKGGARRQ